MIDLYAQAEALNAMTSECHGRSYRAGWYHDPVTREPLRRNVGEMLALVHSEVSEALEGHRKNLKDTHLTDRLMIEVELADVVIRVFDLAGYLKLDLGEGFRRKKQSIAPRSSAPMTFDLQAQAAALNSMTDEGYGTLYFNVGEMLARIHLAVSKAFESYVFGQSLDGRPMIEANLVDVLLRVFDLAGYMKLSLGESYQRKLIYNEQRQDHKLETRAAGGKAF